MLQGKRRYDEVQRGSQYGHNDHYKEVFQGILQQICIIGAETESEADDRSHKRGNEHRAYDDRDGVDVQTYRCDNDGADEDYDVRSSEIYVFLD